MNESIRTEAPSFSDFRRLLDEHEALPQVVNRVTLLEVAGYPHYENVCSNILQFYLDPSAEHGLNNLLLSALLQAAGFGDLVVPRKVEITREHGMEGRMRLDLLVESDTFVMGIENKIFHAELNDFKAYGNDVDRWATNNRKSIKVLLSLKNGNKGEILEGGFVRVTYNQFFDQVRDLLRKHSDRADSKWLVFLLDFIQSVTNLAGENMELKQSDQFFIDNSSRIEVLIGEWESFQRRLGAKVNGLLTEMMRATEISALSKSPWVYAKMCLVLDFNFDGNLIAFDVWLRPTGWNLELFGRRKTDARYLMNLGRGPVLSEICKEEKLCDGRFILESWPLSTSAEVISESLRPWIRRLVEAHEAEVARTEKK